MTRPGEAGSAPRGGLHTEMLPARQGDCVVLQWPDGPRRRRLLVDAGPAPAYDDICHRLRSADGRDVDLLVLTHVDADHIEGTILLLNDRELALDVHEVWFNGAGHLDPDLNGVHGEILSAILVERGIPWNCAFAGRAVVTAESGPLPVRTLPGGLRLTVLGPDLRTLRRLRDEWMQACRDAHLDFDSVDSALAALRARPRLSPRDSYLLREPPPEVRQLARARRAADRSVPNASSIVLLAEWGDSRVLLAGDSTPDVLAPALQRLLEERGVARLPLTAFKLPHHGSAKNLTADLVRALPAKSYLFSSDGSYFEHPDDVAVATVLEYGPVGLELVFNYDSPRNRRWANPALVTDYGHSVRFPRTDGGTSHG